VRAEIDYHAPAVLGDEVEVTVRPVHRRRVRFTLAQEVVRCRDSVKLVSAQITIACLTTQGKLIPVPDLLARALA
jgi:acyl-CoA thioesterase FadM